MRRLTFFLGLLVPALATASEFCTIPTLYRGVPVTVPVPHIGKHLCGMALIEKQYVRLEEVAQRKVLGPVRCNPSGDDCRQRAEYFLSRQDSEQPFIVIYQGPRTGDPG